MSSDFLPLNQIVDKLNNEQAIVDANKKYNHIETRLKLVEEMAELMKEIIKSNEENLLQEFGDVLIVMTRLYSYFNKSERLTILNFMNSKIARLAQTNAAKDTF